MIFHPLFTARDMQCGDTVSRIHALRTVTMAVLFVCVGVLSSPMSSVSSGIGITQLLSTTNDVRAVHGRLAFDADPLLMRAAQQRAQELLDSSTFTHWRPNGSSFSTAARDTKYPYAELGENIAVNYLDTPSLLQAWETSDAHRANLFSSRFSDIGIGIAQGMFRGVPTILVVQLYGLKRPSSILHSEQPQLEQ